MAPVANSSPEIRENLIKHVLLNEFGRVVTALSTLGRDSNNFVYRVQVSQASDDSIQRKSQGWSTSGLPNDVTEVVMRISNREVNLNEDVRVQNEVAAISLTRDALGDRGYIVPRVFGWRPATDEHGWILQEFLKGSPVDQAFEGMDPTQKRGILRQVAEIFKLIQSYHLPSSVAGYGGLRFDDQGVIVSGETTVPNGGPFDSVADLYAQFLRKQLQFADICEVVAGWNPELKKRLNKFADHGIRRVVEANSEPRPTLIHGDFDLHNMLFDPATGQVTGLLDYDFAYVGSPADEYWYSFGSIQSILVGPLEEGGHAKLREFLLHGWSDNLIEDSEGIDWDTARILDEEFSKAGVRRPSDIKGSGELAAIYWFILDVSPPFFMMPRWRAKRTPEKIQKIREATEVNLNRYLERWGI